MMIRVGNLVKEKQYSCLFSPAATARGREHADGGGQVAKAISEHQLRIGSTKDQNEGKVSRQS